MASVKVLVDKMQIYTWRSDTSSALNYKDSLGFYEIMPLCQDATKSCTIDEFFPAYKQYYIKENLVNKIADKASNLFKRMQEKVEDEQ